MVHLYWGNGKGKTTAAMGLALRALGSGQTVTILQFLKSTPSGEIALLEQLGAHIYRGMPTEKFVFSMNEEEKQATSVSQEQLLQEAIQDVGQLFVIDEACAAVSTGMVESEQLKAAVEDLAQRCEVVMTGHSPQDWMYEMADYETEMRCVKHPYQKGIVARKGVEY